jgi:hypothetical protein
MPSALSKIDTSMSTYVRASSDKLKSIWALSMEFKKPAEVGSPLPLRSLRSIPAQIPRAP